MKAELPARPRRPWDRTEPQRRDYFELLGPGLVAVKPGRRPASSGGWSPPTGGAWLHVGPDDRVRAFSGKAEVGQGTRLALQEIVARALAVPRTGVEMCMGDTDLCPWDMGTFGSRSMPDAAPALAAAATGARTALLRLASTRLERPLEGLEVVNGQVRAKGADPSVGYGSLVRDLRELYVVPEDPAPSNGSTAGAGSLTTRPDELSDVVTGRRGYVSDLSRPGMLYGAVLWPPVRGAHLRSVDPGLDADDGSLTIVHDGPFVGVAAATSAQARRRLSGVVATWERPSLPSESDIEPYLRAHPSKGDDWDTESDTEGDVGQGLAQATSRVSAEFRTAYIAHVPLEPRCALAEWSGDRVTIWVGTQTPFRARATVAQALGMSEDDVRVIVPPTGAGFGGKHGGDVATAAARLARAARRPVRVAFTREEEFRNGYLRPMSIVEVRAGADARGHLTAWSAHNLNGGSSALVPPYRVRNRSISNTLSDSPLAQGPYRSLAAIANNFARESVVDELAHATRLDPREFRDRNLEDERLRAVLRTAADLADWEHRERANGVGWGLAVGEEKGGRVATVAQVSVDRGRRVHVDRMWSAFAAGTIVHPDNLRSQVEGAHVMALGGALFEALHFSDGSATNPRLSEYRVPRFSDLPDIEVELVNEPAEPPAGAGETPMIAVAPAVANAIFDASGQRLRSLPLVPTGRLAPA
jgi:nicotinate dehydrogenase subunit B